MTCKQKNKGNSWERDLCKILGEVLGGNFQRVPTSGAFTGGMNSFRKGFLSENQQKLFKGDIIPPDHITKLVVECKFYSQFAWNKLLCNAGEDAKQLDKWIEQTIESANEGDFWIVAIKINNMGSFVVFEEKYAKDFQLSNRFIYKTFILTDLKSFLNTNKEKILKISA